MRTTIISIAMAACIGACGAAEAGGELKPADPGGEDRQSRYTSLRGCPVIEAVPEEAGYVRSLCPGLGGYDLEFVEVDGRHDLVVVPPDGPEQSLSLPSLSGGGFSNLGERVEWRGMRDGGVFRPDAMIVRYDVVENPDEPTKPTSYLLAVSLAETPCLAARIAPGPEQNERARNAADGIMHCM